MRTWLIWPSLVRKGECQLVEGMKGTSDRDALVRAFLGFFLLASAADVFTSNVVVSSRMIGVLTHEHQPRKVPSYDLVKVRYYYLE